MSLRVLVAITDSHVSSKLLEMSRELGCEAFGTKSASTILETIEARMPELVLVDPGFVESEVFSTLLARDEAPVVIVVASGEANVENLFARGASDVVPATAGFDDLRLALARASRVRALELELEMTRREISERESAPLIARSRAMKRVIESVARVASTPRTTVLITGEVGSGKEAVARAIHAESGLSRGPFVRVDCTVESQEELAAQLFGAEPAAHHAPTTGLFAKAAGGTVFLNGIAALSADLQGALSRALTDRVYRRVEGSTDLALDFRLVASSRQDLGELVDLGRFREDLFYRLNVLSIRVPPLRERAEDIADLASYFLDRAGRRLGKSFQEPTREAIDALVARDWPANLLELGAAIERVALEATSREVSASDFGATTHAGADGVTLPSGDLSMKCMERELIRTVLEVTEGNRSKAARVLQVNRTTLYNKLKLYDLGGSD